MLHVAGGPKGVGPGVGGKAAGGTKTLDTPATQRLRKSEVFKQLEEYDSYLEEGHKQQVRTIRSQILLELANDKIPYKKAASRIRDLLNRAREKTAELGAAGVVHSNFTVEKIVSIPSRSDNVPILDQVFTIKHRDHDFLFNEVKPPQATPRVNPPKPGKPSYEELPVVRAREFWFENRQLMTKVVGGRVHQGSPEWYYHRLAEIFRKGGANRKFANELFSAIRKGRVLFGITRSGIKLEPELDLTTTKVVTKWFKDAKWDMSHDFPILLDQ